MRRNRTRTSHCVELWLPRTERDALSDHAEREGRSMGEIVRQWLRPNLAAALAGQPLPAIPDSVEIHRWPHWVRFKLLLPIREYQAARFAASRLDASRNRLLYSWLQPHLQELKRRAA